VGTYFLLAVVGYLLGTIGVYGVPRDEERSMPFIQKLAYMALVGVRCLAGIVLPGLFTIESSEAWRPPGRIN
jgi:hypothetical protein